jgi:hypothetical protein
MHATPLGIVPAGTVFYKKHIQGTEVLKRLRDMLPGLPVVAISGRASDETLVEALMTGGAFNFLLKPFAPSVIINSVASAVQKEKIRNHLADSAAEWEAGVVIEGISGDIHIFVKQYGDYFEQYIRHFKGVEVKPVFRREFDTLRVAFETEHSLPEIKAWFREYLAFSEQYETVNPVIATPRTAEEVITYTEQLNLQIKHFAACIESTYWNNPVEPLKQPLSPHAAHLNPLKIVNGHLLKTRQAGLSALQVAAAKVVRKAEDYITNAETLPALGLLIDFCEEQGETFTGIKNEILMLKYKIARALNDKRRNLSPIEACHLELDKAHDVLIFDILPAIEKMAQRKGAA